LSFCDLNIVYIPIMTEIWQSPHWPNFTYSRSETEPILAQAAGYIGEISGLLHGLDPEQREAILLAQIVAEARSSFQIEGVSLPSSEIEASVVASLKHRDRAAISRRSDAVAALMAAARRSDQTLDQQTLFDWHELLFFGVEIENRGRWRSFEIEITRSASAGHHDVLYRPVPATEVGREMQRFLTWLNAPDDTAPPIRAALAHLWFESIHPFSDGNGRIGRALIEHVFASQRVLPFSLSRQIEKDKKAYYAALQAGRQEGRGGLDATPFVVWFLQTIIRAAELAREEALFVLRKNGFLRRFQPQMNTRQRKVMERLFVQGAGRVEEGISAKSYTRIAQTSSATATRDLRGLETMGALVRSEAGGRSTLYHIIF
jgi:Fic family protein